MPKRRCFFRGSSAANLGLCPDNHRATRRSVSDYFCRNAGAGREFCATVCGGSLIELTRPRDLPPGFRYEYWEREARGLELLKQWLSPEQFAQYDAKSYFEVFGCHRGKRYRVSRGTSMNIHELDGAGCPCVGWCFVPKGHLVAGDIMLAQKIALETDERGALAVANRFSVLTGRRNMLLYPATL